MSIASAQRAIDAALFGPATDASASGKGSTPELCLSLLPLFNFSTPNRVTNADWQRGTQALCLHDMAKDDTTWTNLLRFYGDATGTAVDLARVQYLVPLEPHIAAILRAIVTAVDLSKAKHEVDDRKQAAEVEVRTNRFVLNQRRKVIQPPFAAWSGFVRFQCAVRQKGEKYGKRIMHHQIARAFEH